LPERIADTNSTSVVPPLNSALAKRILFLPEYVNHHPADCACRNPPTLPIHSSGPGVLNQTAGRCRPTRHHNSNLEFRTSAVER
jgi:hypothetical protein